jgi:RHS repeat-associated protein
VKCRLSQSTTVLAGVLSALLHAPAAHADGVDPTKLSLPKGPASVEGLGRSFEPSLASGTASYGIEVKLPPAVGGFSPRLSLDYDSAGGVSELGMGWKLGGVPRIRRRIEEGLPRFDDSDSFELSGLGTPCELLEVSPRVFRLRYEDGSFVRVQRSADGGQWEARDKTGTVYRFGGEGFVEQEAGNVATYLLREQVDLHGHTIRYEWDSSSGHALLTSITLNDFGDAARIQVQLSYEDRPDVMLSYGSGIRRLLSQRLVEIEITRGAELVRRYHLSYHDAVHSQLAAVQMVGHDGETALPPLSFQYTEPSFAADGQLTPMQSAPGRSPGEADVELADLNGDGLPDLLSGEPGRFRSYINHDGSSWLEPQDWAAGNSPSVSLSTAGVELADLDGDGAVDLVVKSGTDSFRYSPGLDGTRFSPSVPISTVPSFTFEDPDVRLADMDGDRRTDVVVTSEAGLGIGYNLNGRDWTEPETIGVVDPDQPLRFSDGGRTQLCDLNGDRVQDLCVLRSGSLTYWLGRGRGRFEPATTTTTVPQFEPSDPWQLTDLNGDGWVDLLHVGVAQVSYALATGIGHFSEPRRINGTPERLSTTTVKLADLNGSGTTDILWVDVSGSLEHSWQYLELFPDGRGGLLRRVDNGLGKVVRISYEPAAASAARARAQGRPWSGRINVAMPVVRRVEVDSSLGDPLTGTEYDYRDGTWDPRERTFAGFAGGVQIELGDASTPTLLTESTFDTGLSHRTLRGKVLQSEQHDEQGHIFTRLLNSYATPTLELGLDGRAVEYAYRSSEQIDHIEGTDLSATRSVLTEWEQDEFGNVTVEASWGEVAGTDYLVGNDESITVRTFANNRQDWVLGHVATEEVRDGSGNRVAVKRVYYDGEPFEGLPSGEVTRGDVRRVETWIERDRYADEARYEHDEHGNVVAAYDARGGRSEYDYDLDSSTFVVAERKFPGDGQALQWAGRYDERFGLPTSVSGPNGEQHRMRYDALGRLVSIVKPGDSLELATVRFRYDLASPLSTIRTETRERSGEPGTIVSVEHIDGLGRKRASAQESAEPGRYILSDLVAFDARGNASFSAFPTEERSADLPRVGNRDGTHSSYDATGRVLSTTHVDGSSTSTVYLPLERRDWDENDDDPESEHYDTPTSYRLDGLGRLVEVIERAANRQITTGSYHYDPLGNVTRIRDAAGSERHYRYDGRSRRTRIDDPNAGAWHLEYTDGNDLALRIDPSGHQIRYEYDDLGRVVQEYHQRAGDGDERLVTSHHYDEPSAEHSDYENLRGELAWVEDEAGSVFFSYDPRGRLTRKTRRWQDGTEHTTRTDYDAADRPVRRGFPDHSDLDLSYDARGMLSAIGAVVTDIRWTPHGQLQSVRLGNGMVDERSYDGRRRLSRLEAASPSGQILRGLRLVLDAASRVREVEDLRPGVSAHQSLAASYRYDDRYRLTQATDRVATTSWTYDDVANILSVQSGHDAPWLNVENRFGEDGAGPDQMTRHGSEVIRYDEAGRVVRDGERRLEWDAKGRLSRVERGDVVEEYVYDYADSRALKRTTRGEETTVVRYIDDDVEERDGKLIRYVLLGEQRVARLDGFEGESPEPVSREEQEPPLPAATPPGVAGPGAYHAGRVMLVLLTALMAALLLAARRLGSRQRLVQAVRWAASVALGARRVGSRRRLVQAVRWAASLALGARRVGSRRRLVQAVRWGTSLALVTLLVPACQCGSPGELSRNADPSVQSRDADSSEASRNTNASEQSRDADGSEEPHPITQLPDAAVFYLGDEQHSPLVLANAQGEVIRAAAYHPYGSLRHEQGEATDPFAFVGNEQDSGAGLGDFKARPYRAPAAVFLAPDPVAVFEAEELVEQPARLAAYSYAGGSPIDRSDPGGKFWDAVLDAGFIGFDVGTIIAENVIGRTTENLKRNVVALALDVACAALPVAVGAGLAYRAGKLTPKAVSHTAEIAAQGAKHAPNAAAAAPETAKVAPKAAADRGSKAIQRYWPPNRGFLHPPTPVTLRPGTRIDRFGHEGGTFASPQGTPFALRGLPPRSASKPYRVYEAVKPLDVNAGTAAPAFGGGLGPQYELPQSIEALIQSGHLRRVQ